VRVRICTKCGEEKGFGEFHKNAKGKYGLASRCKICESAYAKQWNIENNARNRARQRSYRKQNRARLRESLYRWRAKNKEASLKSDRAWARTPSGNAHALLKSARRRAKRYDMPFSLTKDWVQIKLLTGNCELTGIEFDSESAGISPFSPSLDRIKPELGYTEENCRVVCWVLNAAMNNWGLEPVLKMASALLERKNG